MEEIIQYIQDLEKDTKQIKYELSKLIWFMRGGLSYEEAYYTSYEDREILFKVVDENLEMSKKVGQVII